jgi:hypothetical protein
MYELKIKIQPLHAFVLLKLNEIKHIAQERKRYCTKNFLAQLFITDSYCG